MKREYYEDDRQRDYTEYINMPEEERKSEIARLEAEARKERDRLRCEKHSLVV